MKACLKPVARKKSRRRSQLSDQSAASEAFQLLILACITPVSSISCWDGLEEPA